MKGKRWERLLALVLVLLLTVAGLGLQQTAPFGEPPLPGVAPDAVDLPPVQSYAADPADFARDEPSGLAYVKNIAIVYFAPDATQAQKTQALAAVDGEIVGRADAIGKWEIAVQGESLAALEALCKTLERQPGVTAAGVDHVLQLYPQAVVTNDPWATPGYPSAATNRWYMDAIEAPEAWEANAYLAEQPCIGVVDTGVLASHEEFAGGIVTNLTSFRTPAAFGEHNYSFASVATWHGTAVASLIAAKANNGKGLAGLCWDAKVFALDWDKASSGRTTESVLYDGLIQCVIYGARAVNFSVGLISNEVAGSSFSLTQTQKNTYAQTAADLLAQMLSYGGTVPQFRRFVVVQSAGNQRNVDASNNGFFACVTPTNTGKSAEVAAQINDLILVVGAVQQESDGSFKQWTMTTNTYNGTSIGTRVDVYAPGASIFGAGVVADEYVKSSGTSMAAPLVSATAALMSAANPALSGWEIGALLRNAAVSPVVVKDRTSYVYTRYPMLNAKLAVTTALGLSPGVEPALQPTDDADVLVLEGERRVAQVAARTRAADLGDDLEAVGAYASIVYAKAAGTPDAYAATGDAISVVDIFGRSVAYSVTVEGDLNGDGRVNAADAQQLELHLAGAVDLAARGAAFLAAADFNGDGTIDAADYLLLAYAGVAE
ncbi:MAG: S8 family serine peptidase [Oscillospiraceae bacterium]|jgi:subtilisin family serine protease|nr:S8 family serine peptidase [Oscillospiraceae bacterium]